MKWIVEADTIDDIVLGRYVIDLDPLTECKDCRYWEESLTIGGKGYCKDLFGRRWKAEDFCSYAERRTNGC